MMRIAVCDDQEIFLLSVAESIETWQKSRGIRSLILERFQSSEDLLIELEKNTLFDIVFLDILIPDEINGMKLAEVIRATNEYTQIVFITNYANYAIEGYRVNALRYLEKPVHPSDIAECMDIAYRQWEVLKQKSVMLDLKASKVVLELNSIDHIEAQKHSVMVHQNHISEQLVLRIPLNEIYDALPHDLFVQCSRSYIVNIQYIRRITRDTVTLANGISLPIGKHCRNAINEAFDRFHQGI